MRRTATERFMDLSFLEQIILIVVAICLFTVLFKITGPDTSFACGTDGTETVIVMKDRNSTISEIASRYCVGSIESATSAMVKTYGTDLREGQIIRLPGK